MGVIEISDHKKRYTLRCKVCGKIFTSSNYNIATCSPECLKEFIKRRKIYIKQCLVCGVEFKTQNKKRRYCSKKCCNKHYHNGDKVLLERKREEKEMDLNVCNRTATSYLSERDKSMRERYEQIKRGLRNAN